MTGLVLEDANGAGVLSALAKLYLALGPPGVKLGINHAGATESQRGLRPIGLSQVLWAHPH